MNSKVLKLIRDVEFSNDNSKLLHKNPTENGLTYYGIYQSAHPDLKLWRIVQGYLELEPDLKKCSKILSGVSDLNKMVEDFYKKEFWDKMKLDLVSSEHKQLELLCFAIVAGIPTCIRKLQQLLNTKVDGIIGNQTINALNAFNEALFDKLFDDTEIKYFDSLDEKKYGIYKRGWRNRAVFI